MKRGEAKAAVQACSAKIKRAGQPKRVGCEDHNEVISDLIELVDSLIDVVLPGAVPPPVPVKPAPVVPPEAGDHVNPKP